ncbi:MAG: YbaB/EbfC family nucleoid-associated protein [bacterium]|nr:YbaB/EbfC family nucleoid-associated protein [bacterium]
MFDKLRDLKKIKDIQDSFKKERFDAEKDGVKISMNGNFEVEEIILNPDFNNEKNQEALKQNFNDLVKQVQMNLAKQFFK